MIIMVLKIELDRQVQSSIGHDSGPIRSIRPEIGWTRIEPTELVIRPMNRTNGSFPFKSDSSIKFFFLASKQRCFGRYKTSFQTLSLQTIAVVDHPSRTATSSHCRSFHHAKSPSTSRKTVAWVASSPSRRCKPVSHPLPL